MASRITLIVMGLLAIGCTFVKPAPLLFKQTLKDNLENVDAAVACDLCIVTASFIREIVTLGDKTFVIPIIANVVCRSYLHYADQVCKGAITTWAPQIFFLIQRVYLSPKEVCYKVLGPKCGTEPSEDYFWNITLPTTPKPPLRPPTKPPNNAPRLRVLHVSDIHLDQFYVKGANADCGMPDCCRISDAGATTKFRAAGNWGDVNCDLPILTFKSFLQSVKLRSNDIDVVYCTGDLPDHHVWKQNRSEQIDHIFLITTLIKEIFTEKPILFTLGNHEGAPVNSFAPNSIDVDEEFRTGWLYRELVKQWSSVPQEQHANLIKGGYYVVQAAPGLRVIALNTNYCSKDNWWLLINSTDPDQQLQWLANELQSAEDAGDQVHILGHHPPNTCMKSFSTNYYRIVNRYETTISAQFFGHTHQDSFIIFYDLNQPSRPVSSAMVVPSLTNYLSLSSAYRIYEIDGVRPNSTFQILNHATYVMNLTEANQKENPFWRLEYNTTTDYHMQTAFPQDWQNLVESFSSQDDVFQKFYRFHFKSSLSENQSNCTSQCKADLICEIKRANSFDTTIPC